MSRKLGKLQMILRINFNRFKWKKLRENLRDLRQIKETEKTDHNIKNAYKRDVNETQIPGSYGLTFPLSLS